MWSASMGPCSGRKSWGSRCRYALLDGATGVIFAVDWLGYLQLNAANLRHPRKSRSDGLARDARLVRCQILCSNASSFRAKDEETWM
jgi:hypothetical protein